MKRAVIALTKNGLKLAERIFTEYPDNTCVFTKQIGKNNSYQIIKGDFKSFVQSIYNQYRVLIFICATGIAVRSLAPLIQNKTVDPAVLVIDDCGKNVISLLSGHIGGANQECIDIAGLLKANPVITTASDNHHKISIDLFAMEKNLIVDDMEKAKQITALIVNDEPVKLISDFTIDHPPYLNTPESSAKGYIIISNKIHKKNKCFIQLIPQNITLGIGCKKGKPGNQIIKAVKNIFHDLSIKLESIRSIHTIDLKMNEKGIIECAEYLKRPVKFHSKKEINQINIPVIQSEFVKKATGVYSVSESCAYLGSEKKGKFLINKAVCDGITISVYEANNENR